MYSDVAFAHLAFFFVKNIVTLKHMPANYDDSKVVERRKKREQK